MQRKINQLPNAIRNNNT